MTIEVRYGIEGHDDIDEIVSGTDTRIHLERMDFAAWSLIVESPTSRLHFSIRKKGKEVIVRTVEADMTEGWARSREGV